MEIIAYKIKCVNININNDNIIVFNDNKYIDILMKMLYNNRVVNITTTNIDN